MTYDVTIITVRPGTHPPALPRLERALSVPEEDAGELLACWYSDLGALNQILIIRSHEKEAARLAQRAAELNSKDPFGIGELIMGISIDTYESFPFLEPMRPGRYGPFYEVRTYLFRPDGLIPTIELWRSSLPGRQSVSPVLAAMHCLSGSVLRFMHIWPYASLDERQRLRTKAVRDGVWPPPGGPDHFTAMQSDIYLPADFSPMR